MNLVPEHRSLLGVDVVGSARNPGYHLNAVSEAINKLLPEALRRSGISRTDCLRWEPTGDGALVVLPSPLLGSVLDAAQHLDQLAVERNRWHKPDVRFRVAVELGPVGDDQGLYDACITHTRLLAADAFKQLFERCVGENEDTTTALVVSDHALRAAFGGDHTTVVRRSEFAPLPMLNKEYSGTPWVRVPGFDARCIATFIEKPAPTPAVQPQARVVNQVNGAMYGVQAEVVNGGITLGTGPR